MFRTMEYLAAGGQRGYSDNRSSDSFSSFARSINKSSNNWVRCAISQGDGGGSKASNIENYR